jgi:hypothetical protein
MIFRYLRSWLAHSRGWAHAAPWRCGLLKRHIAAGEDDAFQPQPFPEPGGRAAELCRQYLLLKYPERISAAEAFIRQIDRTDSGMEGAQWRAFIDTRSAADEILKPLDRAFQEWSQT